MYVNKFNCQNVYAVNEEHKLMGKHQKRCSESAPSIGKDLRQ